MTLHRFFLIVALSLSLGNCAYLHSFDANLAEKIDQWIEEEKYHKALKTLEHVKDNKADYALLMQKREQIIKLAEKLEQKTISRTNQLVRNNEWHKAAQLYEKNLEKIPEHEKLRQSYADFLEKRQAYLKDLELRLLIKKSAWLGNNTVLYDKIKKAIPGNYQSVSGVRDYEHDREQALQALIECIRTSSSANRLDLAKTCLSLAQRIDRDIQYDPRVASARKKINQEKAASLRQYKQKTTDILSNLRQGYSLDNLQRSHDHLKASSDFPSLDKEAMGLLDELDRHLKAGIEQRMESARRLYSNGKIEHALQIWESLQTIAPDNQKLNGYIDRAHRVLKKLRQLQEKEPGIPSLQNQN
ncbi:hypothetical protein [Thiohalophilus thiocyanatoxydans]|uniref:Tetratricopeptide repeat protein n=1 Tax=Thiohalophilus thiocyanatoxydans TaxID=381308 RepID=A0A4R8IL86_9GAMM|nr:hypothetical protein [Thiohalophilus thiocyanatoxydans]TDY01551.1 hypothetical protein EDC23_1440 [Thiohalophilus thiocyanatoxydans]